MSNWVYGIFGYGSTLASEDEVEDEAFLESLTEKIKEFPLLSLELIYVNDYPTHCVFVKENMETFYSISNIVKVGQTVDPDGQLQLEEFLSCFKDPEFDKPDWRVISGWF